MTARLLSPVITIGVTGHRSLGDPEAVARRCREVIQYVAELAAAASAQIGPRATGADPVRLRVISPLAEGADRIVAQDGLALGADLHCPLPFFRDVYAADFDSAESRAAFDQILTRATAVFELDGDRGDATLAYARVGEVVVDQSDLLIAIWDGQASRGRGGTAEVVEAALSQGVPTVLVHPDDAHAPELISGSLRQLTRAPWQELAGPLNGMLALGAEASGAELRSGLFDQPSADARAWSSLLANADRLATRYAGFYRATFTANFLLSALAVTAALLGGAEPVKSAGPIALEMGCIGAIIGLTVAARRGVWHERWIDYRQLAERLRPLPLLASLGLALPHQPRPGSSGLRAQRSDPIAWLASRAQRSAGLPNARLDADYVAAVQAEILRELDDQAAYHRRSAARYGRMEQRSQLIGILLFSVTGLVCLLHGLELTGAHLPGALAARLESPLLIVLSGALPAFGAAMLGIRNVGEFSRLARRSAAMSAALAGLRAVLPEGGGPATSAALATLASDLALTLTNEILDWRSLVITRDIELPG